MVSPNCLTKRLTLSRRQSPMSLNPLLLTEELLIGNLLAGYGIWIEIVVDMEAVDVVAAHDVGCHTAGIVGRLLESRIEEHQVIVVEAEIRMGLHHASG